MKQKVILNIITAAMKKEKKRPNYCKSQLNTTVLQFMVEPRTACVVCLCDTSPCHDCCQHVLFSPPWCLTVGNKLPMAGQSSAVVALPQTPLAYRSLVLNRPSLGHFAPLGSYLLTIATGDDNSRNTLKMLRPCKLPVLRVTVGEGDLQCTHCWMHGHKTLENLGCMKE